MSRSLVVVSSLLAVVACRSTNEPAAAAVIVIEGAVAHPGVQAWRADTTALEALLCAEPLDAASDLSRVELVRVESGRTRTLTLDLERAAATGDTTDNVLLHRGDVLRLPERPQR